MKTDVTDPIISIDRASKSWACFDGAELLHGFTDYVLETDAVKLAENYFAFRGIVNPRVVYPRITSMRMTTRRA